MSSCKLKNTQYPCIQFLAGTENDVANWLISNGYELLINDPNLILFFDRKYRKFVRIEEYIVLNYPRIYESRIMDAIQFNETFEIIDNDPSGV